MMYRVSSPLYLALVVLTGALCVAAVHLPAVSLPSRTVHKEQKILVKKPVGASEHRLYSGNNGEGNVFGVDVSSGVSQSTWECLKGNNTFAIVRAYRSSGSVDPAAADTIKAARAAGIEYVDAYHFPSMRVDPEKQVQEGIANLRSNGAKIGQYWLDIERYAWPSNKAANAAFIQKMINGVKAAGASPAIYTSIYSWQEICGDSKVGGDLPLWYPHYESPPQVNFNDFQPFGGWSRPNIKQYKGTSSECGASVDLNWYP